MGDPISGLAEFLAELRRRRVFRVAAVYAVVGWVVIQGSGAILPMLEEACAEYGRRVIQLRDGWIVAERGARRGAGASAPILASSFSVPQEVTMPRSLCGTSAFLGLALACMVALPAPAQGQALQDSLLERMVGRWLLRGTIDGQATTHDVTAEWVLGRQYVQLHEISRERTSGGAPAYEAIVLLGRDPETGGYACLWLDSTGNGGLVGRALGHAPAGAGDRIAFLFTGAGGSRFHTTFVHESGTWRWLMDGEGAGGKLLPFARLTLTRE